MTTTIENQQTNIPIYPSYVHKSRLESLKISFHDTYDEIHETEVVERLITAFKTDIKVQELMKIYHTYPLKRWKKIEDWLKKEKWRYTYTTTYVSMIILGIQHYSDELSAGWWK